MNQKKKCFHKWEDLAIINYLSETSVICNKCGEEVLKAGHPKQQNDRFERIVSRLNTLLTEKYKLAQDQDELPAGGETNAARLPVGNHREV